MCPYWSIYYIQRIHKEEKGSARQPAQHCSCFQKVCLRCGGCVGWREESEEGESGLVDAKCSTHTHIYTKAHTHIHTHIPTHTYQCLDACTHTHTLTLLYTQAHARTHIYIYILQLGCSHRHPHIHTYRGGPRNGSLRGTALLVLVLHLSVHINILITQGHGILRGQTRYAHGVCVNGLHATHTHTHARTCSMQQASTTSGSTSASSIDAHTHVHCYTYYNYMMGPN